jgi:hypothetical protein
MRWLAAVLALATAMHVGASSEHEVGAPVTASIVSGVPTPEFPAVGALLLGDAVSGETECTVVLVGCRTAITAAHCVCPGSGAGCQDAGAPDPMRYVVYFAHAGFVALEQIVVHPDYAFPVADLAVLRLAAPVTGVAPLAMNDGGTPPFGTAGTIVGFGVLSTAAEDSGVKRVGAVTTAPCAEGVPDATSVCWEYTGRGANTCEGDSGGPLLVDLGGGPVLAGTTSGGFSTTCLPSDHSYDANVTVYRDWIAASAAGDVGSSPCGDGPAVGQPGAIATGFAGDVSAARPFATHSVGVALGTRELRVGLNATERPGRDFDLYVRAGAAPTLEQWDCRATGPSQYGFCRIADPAPGSWHLRVERTAGDGFFQLVATTIGGDAASCGNAVREPGEDCDGADAGSCASGCASDCRCVACATSDLDVREIGLAPGLFVRARLGDALGTWVALDPVADGIGIEFLDAARTVPIAIPPGDPGWVRAGPRARTYVWRGPPGSPVRRITLRRRTKRSTTWRVTVAGRDLPGADAVDYQTLVVRLVVGTRCAEHRFHAIDAASSRTKSLTPDTPLHRPRTVPKEARSR